MATIYPAIPDPDISPDSMLQTIHALKEAVEILTAQRGTRAEGVATLQDLVDLGLVDADELPT